MRSFAEYRFSSSSSLAAALGERGIRVLAVATRTLDSPPPYGRGLERELAFAGFLTFLDRPRSDAAAAIRNLARLGVSIKIITGDSKPVAQFVAALVGLRGPTGC